jgi:pilus assembly protein CpaB
MKRRVIFFLIAAFIAMLIVVLINSALRSKQATIEALQRGHTLIVVATRSMPPGTAIESGSVTLSPWPREHMPPGAFTNLQDVAGKILKQPVVGNQPIVAAALFTGEHPGGILPLLIPNGMRAMSIPVNEVSDMSGLILPHTRVDVLVTTGAEGGLASERSRIVLQNVEVIATNAELETGSNRAQEARVVTLLVTPTDAEKLATAIKLGTLQLAMRGFADQQTVNTSGFDAAQLLGIPARAETREARVSAPAKRRLASPVPVRSIEIIRNGTERQTVTFIDGRPVAAAPAPIGPASPPPPMTVSTAAPASP